MNEVVNILAVPYVIHEIHFQLCFIGVPLTNIKYVSMNRTSAR